MTTMTRAKRGRPRKEAPLKMTEPNLNPEQIRRETFQAKNDAIFDAYAKLNTAERFEVDVEIAGISAGLQRRRRGNAQWSPAMGVELAGKLGMYLARVCYGSAS